MKIEIKSYIDFGIKMDKSVVYFTLRGENPAEEALVQSLYGAKGCVLTCNKFLEVSLIRKMGGPVMARKTNSTKSKRRQKSGRRKDYTAVTALALRSPEARYLDRVQRREIARARIIDRLEAVRRRTTKEEAHAARYGAKQ